MKTAERTRTPARSARDADISPELRLVRALPLLPPYNDAVEAARISRILDEWLPPAEIDEVIGDRVFYKDPHHRQSDFAKHLSHALGNFAWTLDLVNRSVERVEADTLLEYYINLECDSFTKDMHQRDAEREHIRNLITTAFTKYFDSVIKYFEDAINEAGYTGEVGADALPAIIYLPDQSEPEPAPPSSSLADPQQEGMRDDFAIAAKKARAERRAAAQLTGRLANYQFLARTVDLENPALALSEQRRRAYLLLTAYERVQQVKEGFRDSNVQLTAARRIKSAARRERLRAKRPPAPRGRPRKAAQPKI